MKALPMHFRQQIRSPRWFAIGSVTVSAFLLYVATLAPGLTWAHHGADGGELLAAALTNGVPHPPGYPLYILLLQGWLWLGRLVAPGADPAWIGNLFSASCAALSAGVTVRVAASLLSAEIDHQRWRWYLAALVGLAWSVAPLPWSQALITEVYALHMLLLALLGWAILVKAAAPNWFVPLLALGVAHHLTFLLLLPAVLYYLWFGERAAYPRRAQLLLVMAVGGGLGLLFHLRTPLVAATVQPAPINWGYPDNWEGFWWLVSGVAYRSYLFGAPSSTLLARVAAWAGTLTAQLTPVGLAFMLVGLSHWDRHYPHLRNWSLLWLAPVSIYAINYYTRDSEIYLLPVIWLMILWFGIGLAIFYQWMVKTGPRLQQRVQSTASAADAPPFSPRAQRRLRHGIGFTLLLALCILVGWRWSTISARTDLRAQIFLQETIAVLEPQSIIVTSADAETFALWYGAWGSGELLDAHPDVVLLNYALYQFPWYHRLMARQYPDVVGESSSVEEILAMNSERPVFFSEPFSFWPAEQMRAVGPIWRYLPPDATD